MRSWDPEQQSKYLKETKQPPGALVWVWAEELRIHAQGLAPTKCAQHSHVSMQSICFHAFRPGMHVHASVEGIFARFTMPSKDLSVLSHG